MMFPVAYSRVLACYVAVSEGLRRTDCGTMLGGRDKRPRADRRYGIVVVDCFTRRAERHGAARTFNRLLLRAFLRAALVQERRPA